MIIFTDGSNHDDTLTMIAALESGQPIEAIVITANGWGTMGPSYMIFNNLTHLFDRGEIPIIMGSLYSIKDMKENRETDASPTGNMFGRAVEREFIFELDIMYGLAPELRQFSLPEPRYDPNYMVKIIEIVRNMDNIRILSLGGMTDVWYTVEWLVDNGRRDNIESIWQMGGFIPEEGIPSEMRLIDRSHASSFNIYLDPDAASRTLEEVPEKIRWISNVVSSKNRYDPYMFGPRPSSMGERLTSSLIDHILRNSADSITMYRGTVIAWDLSSLVIMLNPEIITDSIIEPVVINDDSGVQVTRTDDETTVCYRYNNDLASISVDEVNGHNTVLIRDVDADRLMTAYRRMMKVSDPSNLPGQLEMSMNDQDNNIPYQIPPGTNPLFPSGFTEVPENIDEALKMPMTFDTGTIVGLILGIVAIIFLKYWLTSKSD